MITYTSDSHQTPSQNKTKLILKKNCQKLKFLNFARNLICATHLLKLLDKMYKYEMDTARTVGTTEQTRDAGRTDGRTDRWSETNIPPNNFVVRGYNSTRTLFHHHYDIKLDHTHILDTSASYFVSYFILKMEPTSSNTTGRGPKLLKVTLYFDPF